MSTDDAWRAWGEKDPYFGVITDPRFRRDQLTAEAWREFFVSGEGHVRFVLDTCARLAGGTFEPRSALDFGCGVGRVTLPLAAHVERVVGLDIAPAVLLEAQRNAAKLGRSNVAWLLSDDSLSALHEKFDLVHTCITLQHIEPNRGIRIFEGLVRLIADDGMGAIQVTYAKSAHADTYGRPPEFMPAEARRRDSVLQPQDAGDAPRGIESSAPASEPEGDPEMKMISYDTNALLYVLQSAGVVEFMVRFTDHGGELGVFVFFRKPAPDTAVPVRG